MLACFNINKMPDPTVGGHNVLFYFFLGSEIAETLQCTFVKSLRYGDI